MTFQAANVLAAATVAFSFLWSSARELDGMFTHFSASDLPQPNTEESGHILDGITHPITSRFVDEIGQTMRHRKAQEEPVDSDPIIHRPLSFAHGTFEQVVPNHEAAGVLGSLFIFRAHATSRDVDGIFVSGSCQQTQGQIPAGGTVGLGVVWCDFTYSFQDELLSSFSASGVGFDGLGARLAIDGGTGLLRSVRGEVKIHPGNEGDSFLDSELYYVNATLIL